MPQSNHEIARAFFAALSAGCLPDSLLTLDMTAWTTTSGIASDKARYQGGIKLLASVFNGGLTYTVESLTAEEDRIAAEVTASGTLVDGNDFANRYVFMLRIRDGKTASVAEHFNPAPVMEKLAPLLKAAMARGARA